MDDVRLIEAAKAGKESAFDELVDKYDALVMSLVVRYAPAGYTDDFKQEALIGLFNAVMRYDTSQNSVTFGLYAKICIENSMKSQLREISKRVPVEQIDSETSDYGDPAESFSEKENLRELWKIINENLSGFEKRVWELYLSGETAESIAKTLSKDARSINNALFRIRKKLRSALKKHN